MNHTSQNNLILKNKIKKIDKKQEEDWVVGGWN
jgi:hypothetical protein